MGRHNKLQRESTDILDADPDYKNVCNYSMRAEPGTGWPIFLPVVEDFLMRI